MTPAYFAELTRRGIQSDGFADYLPTACFPTLCVVTTLQGHRGPIVPAGVVHDWASKRAGGKPYLVAFKIDATHFQVDSVEAGNTTSEVFEVPLDRR